MMHSRNIYRKKPANFAEIGEHYEGFRKHLIPTKAGGYTVNFKDPNALRELTISLLDHDFGLKVDLPLDRLIPTIPQRLNYIHWVEDLLQTLPDVSKSETVRGIDIGTGASCVYPLLGAKMNGWTFCASEVDSVSFRFACDNVKRNNLEGNIQVQLVTSDTFVKPLLKSNEQYDFCMCNPPFFSDEAEATGNRSRTGHRPTPSSVCTGTLTETVTAGGEVEFVGGIIGDSLELQSKIKWYTTMLGKKSSVAAVVSKLKTNGIQNIVTTEFCQGRTMRWGVAWTFLPGVVTEDPPRKKRKSKPLEFNIPSEKFYDEETPSNLIKEDHLVYRICDIVRKILLDFQVSILSEREQNTTEDIKTSFHCGAKCNTWANQRRRRREEARRLTGTPSLNQTETSLNSSALPGRVNEKFEDIKTTGNIPKVAVQSYDKTTQNLDENSGVVAVKCSGDSERSRKLINDKGCREPLELSRSLLNVGYFIEFHLEVGVKFAEVIPGVFPNVFLRMEWVSGKDRNSMYQLFQYFQNHLLHSI